MWLIPSIPPWSNPILDRFADEFDISRESMMRYAENLLEDYHQKNPNIRDKTYFPHISFGFKSYLFLLK